MPKASITVNGGAEYFFPQNPTEFIDHDSIQISTNKTLKGHSIVFPSFHDSRRRTMTWLNLPNRDDYNTLALTLRAAREADDVVIKYNDLLKNDVTDTGRKIRIEDVNITFKDGAGSPQAINAIDFDLRFVFTILMEV